MLPSILQGDAQLSQLALDGVDAQIASEQEGYNRWLAALADLPRDPVASHSCSAAIADRLEAAFTELGRDFHWARPFDWEMVLTRVGLGRQWREHFSRKKKECRHSLCRTIHVLDEPFSKAVAARNERNYLVIGMELDRHLQGRRKTLSKVAQNVRREINKWACELLAECVAELTQLGEDVLRLKLIPAERITSQLRPRNSSGVVCWDEATTDRNKWIYELVRRGDAYKTILARLKSEHSDWDQITSVNGIKEAAKSYATACGLEVPPRRRPGRPHKQTK